MSHTIIQVNHDFVFILCRGNTQKHSNLHHDTVLDAVEEKNGTIKNDNETVVDGEKDEKESLKEEPGVDL